MIKLRQLIIAGVIFGLLAIFITWSVVHADTRNFGSNLTEENEIRSLIESYFEIRYRTRSTLQLEEFKNMTSEFQAKSSTLPFTELDKMEVELQHARQYHLGYSEYKYFLDFKEIIIDPFSLTATISVNEGHDVVFDISDEIAKTTPIISSMRNLQHRIGLRKEQGEWKIISDHYEDYLWRLIRDTGLSKDELLQPMNEAQSLTGNVDGQQSSTICSLPSDASRHSYNRFGAVAYAHQWATAPRPYNHPPYDDFTDMGGDCTNFVSQAIKEGGNAYMVFGNYHGVGTPGWYYYNMDDRAAAWNDVGALHKFINEYQTYPSGPEGCDVAQHQVYEGDLIQYDWENDGLWNHSVIIVRTEMVGPNNYFHWTAAHTPDTYDYPFTDYIINYPNMIYRFIHIDGIDGYATSYLSPVMNNPAGALNQIYPNFNPYPGPQESNGDLFASPYPGP